MSFKRIDIDKNWVFKQATNLGNGTASDRFYPTAKFPTVTFIDLLHHKLIPDPLIDDNELKVQWVNEADWVYKTTFEGVAVSEGERAILVFEGLDTVVDVYLNDINILSAKDMYLGYRVDVTEQLLKASPGQITTLELRFKSAIVFSKQERERIGSCGNDQDIHFGGSERLFLRKAQYHWGWDWGPALNSCGPWKPIYFEVFKNKVNDLQVQVDVSDQLTKASIDFTGETDSPYSKITLSLKNRQGNIVDSTTIESKSGTTTATKFKWSIELSNPELWYPFMYGDQPLYEITSTIEDDSSYHSLSKKFGVRRLRLLQEPLINDPGLTFTFEVNNVAVFCGGSNWIPGDLLLPNMNASRYEKWVKTAKAGNQSMIRIWGGGIYEDKSFFDACDREGILVWVDFLFCCGNYPVKPDFMALVEEELRQQIKSSRHHPSLALFCGNNEDYLLANRFNWNWDVNDTEGPWDNTNFPGRYIYEKVMPAIVSELSPEIPFWCGSPYGGKEANDTTIGDTHIWDVWHRNMEPYQNYIDFMSRFVSEFGFESAPSYRTVCQYITDPKQRYPQSRIFEAHDKSPGYQRRYAMYMAENYRFRMDNMEDYIYCTQVLQAEAMDKALSLWRREFKGPGNYRCSGGLVWQLNDIWGGQSWAIVDVNMNRKSSFYTIKRALAPTAIGVRRVKTHEQSYLTRSYYDEYAKAEIWVSSTTLKEQDVRLTVKAFDVETGKPVNFDYEDQNKVFTLLSNRATEISSFLIPNFEQTVIACYLHDVSTSKLISRYVSWPEPYKFLQFNKNPTITVDTSRSADQVIVKSNAPLKGVVLTVALDEGDDAVWDDNYIDLVPGEEVTVKVDDLRNRSITAKWMCSWEGSQGVQHVKKRWFL